jgi:hypothetical protein
LSPFVGQLLSWLFEFLFRQLVELRPGSPFLQRLAERWQQKFGGGSPFRYWAIAGDRDALVSVDSLLTFSAEHRLVAPGDHASVIRPESPDAVSVQVVRNALRDEALPEDTRRAAQGTVTLASKQEADEFDVFVYYTTSNGGEVRQISEQLKQRGIRPWLTEDHVVPGRSWRERLLNDIDSINSVAVFIGKAGATYWQKDPQAQAIAEFSNRGRPVIPVHLKSSPESSELPESISDREPVDFRDPDSEPLERLIDGIRGNAPTRRAVLKITAIEVPPLSVVSVRPGPRFLPSSTPLFCCVRHQN